VKDMIGELIGDFRGKITGVRILLGEHTEMTVNGTERFLELMPRMRRQAFFHGWLTDN
jgi:hypothetical protein